MPFLLPIETAEPPLALTELTAPLPAKSDRAQSYAESSIAARKAAWDALWTELLHHAGETIASAGSRSSTDESAALCTDRGRRQ
jgi:hypothetical protein